MGKCKGDIQYLKIAGCSKKVSDVKQKYIINDERGKLMSEVKQFQFEENGEIFEIFIETKSSPEIPIRFADDDDPGGMGVVNDISTKMQRAQSMIRGYTLYALNAFKNLGDANVEEVSLKFGLKIGGKTGIPYITEGSADCNLEVAVKCSFPSNIPKQS